MVRSPVDLVRYGKRVLRSASGRDHLVRPDVAARKKRLGNDGACWVVVSELLDSQSVVYSVGIGDDISFDLALMDCCGLGVHAFDPTPRSLRWLGKQALPPRFEAHPWGLAAYDGAAQFSAPRQAEDVSYTPATTTTAAGAVELPVFRLETIMAKLGHSRVDLLKMDIEGGEYDVIAGLLRVRPAIPQLLIEFHHRFPEIGLRPTLIAIRELRNAGYGILDVSPSGEEFGFCLRETR